MLNFRLTSCRECAEIPALIQSIDCKLAFYANKLYLNLAYMLNYPVEGCKISTLRHYRRILTYLQCNDGYASTCVNLTQIASRVKYLTAGCKCCDQSDFVVTTTTTTTGGTTTTTTTLAGTTTTTTTTEAPLTLFNAGPTDQPRCEAVDEVESYPLYHDGEGEFPDVGDFVYLDSGGTIPFSTEGSVRWMNGLELETTSAGERVLVTCP